MLHSRRAGGERRPAILDEGSSGEGHIYGAGLVAQVSGANTNYYLADGLGSTMATTDASGNVVNSYTYDVYGKTTASSGSQPNDFQFAGQQTDPTGLQYLRARYYDPETGGFFSREPVAALPGWAGNSHGYASQTPTRALDPSGFYPVDADGCPTNNSQRSCPTASNASRNGEGFVQPASPPSGAPNPAGTPTPPAATSSGYGWVHDLIGHACVALGACVGGSTFVIDGVRFWDGKAGQKEAFNRYAKDFNQSEYASGNKLHALKKQLGIAPDANLTFDEFGNVYQQVNDPRTTESYLEELGNVVDDSFGPGRK